MRESLEHLLEEVARRGSWVGGGSVAAFCAALSAALLEKLVLRPQLARRLRSIRRDCLRLIPHDARMFARVIQASREGKRQNLRTALKTATETPCRIFEHAQAIEAACRAAQRVVKPRFQSDLRCAMAVALAASESARTLIQTNLAWLDDPRYTRAVQRRLRLTTR